MPFRSGLGVEIELQAAISRAPREKQILADFEEIQRFVAHHGHTPQQGEDHDIFACLHAVRLECIQGQADCRALVEPLDPRGFLPSRPMNPQSVRKRRIMMPSWQHWGFVLKANPSTS